MRIHHIYLSFIFLILPTLSSGTSMDARKMDSILGESFPRLFSDPATERDNMLALLTAHKSELPDSSLAAVYSFLGVTHGVQFNYDSALFYFNASLALTKENTVQSIRVSNNIGQVYRNSGQLKKALSLYLDLLPLVEEIDPGFLNYIYSSLASISRGMNLYEEAYEYVQKSIDHVKSLEQTTELELALEHQRLANIYFDLKRYDDAIGVYREILPVIKEGGRLDVYYISLANLSDSYMALEDYPVVDSLLQIALAGSIEMDLSKYESLTLQKLAVLHLNLKEYDVALNYARKAFEITANNESYYYATILSTLIDALVNKGKYDEAFALIRENEEFIGEADEASNIEFFKHKANLLFVTGKYKEAYETLELVNETNLLLQEQRREYALHHAIESHKSEILSKEKEVLQKNYELSYRRQLALLILIALAITIIGYQYIIKELKKRSIKAKLDLSKIQAEKQQIELSILKERQDVNLKIIEQQKIDLLEAASKNSVINKHLAETLELVDANKPLTEIRKKIVNITKEDPYWKTVVKRLQATDKDFFVRITTDYPSLTPGDLELCALARLGLTYKEIAELLNISHESVFTKKYRVSKKIELEDGEDFQQWLMQY
ncbi:MAG: hypothetical protein EA358_09965 [Flavobacteriales bacterium]|nr:MAG: hypothetical protein EA358_09965 [Flavobacteriales bacterium]